MSDNKTSILEIESAVVRFVGDSGDGMQLTGNQFTDTSAVSGNDVVTFPDFPAEIRAPAGTVGGVSGFQVNFSSNPVTSHGDAPDALVAMNPAALITNVKDLKHGGLLVVNSDSFGAIDLRKAGIEHNPFENDTVLHETYQVVEVGMTKLVQTALEEIDLKASEKKRCKNFFALGLMYWVYDRSLDFSKNWIKKKFAKKPILIEANTIALEAGYAYGETIELFNNRYTIKSNDMPSGTYRQVTGNSALAYGLTTATFSSDLKLVYGSYPITPASDILHELAKLKHYDVRTVQAEDEIASIGVALGASYAGSLGVTATSGPGLCLKTEFLGLAAMVELPLVLVNVQRGGPSTGLPTKTEQSDLMLAMYGHNGEISVPVIAPKSPVDCFYTAREAVRIAVEYMTPVIVLSDGFVANSSDLWRVPDIKSLDKVDVEFYEGDAEGYEVFARDEKGARKWVIPGTPDLQHTLTGLEHNTLGDISYDGENHQKMTLERAEKIKNIAKSLPSLEVMGPDSGDVLVIGWGGTYGSICAAVKELRKTHKTLSYTHLTHLNPLHNDLEALMSRFKKVVVVEINLGQLHKVIRSEFAIDAELICKIEGKPFLVSELVNSISEYL